MSEAFYHPDGSIGVAHDAMVCFDPCRLSSILGFIVTRGACFNTQTTVAQPFFLVLAGTARQHFTDILHAAAEGT
ncbi:hypothetical protein D3C79_1000520 [compost metagenome]